MLLVMLLPFVAFSVQRQARGRLEIRQVREGGGLDHSPETFAEYVPLPAVDELQGAPGVPQGVQVLADQHPALNSWFGASSFGILMAEWCAIVEDPMVFNFDVYLPSGKHVHVVVQGSNVEDLIAAVERSFGGVSIRLVTLQGELLVPTQSIREAGLSDGDSLMAVVSPQPQQLCWHFQRGTCTRGHKCKFAHHQEAQDPQGGVVAMQDVLVQPPRPWQQHFPFAHCPPDQGETLDEETKDSEEDEDDELALARRRSQQDQDDPCSSGASSSWE